MNKKQKSRLDRINIIVKIGFVRTDVVKAKRKALGLTMTEAAKLAGMKAAVQWHRIESGQTKNPRLKMVYAVATALQCDAADLLRKR